MPERNSGPSAHLTFEELRCKDKNRTEYPDKWKSTRLIQLAQAFELVRLEYGGPLIVLSAYRTEAHNRAVGGSKLSQHVEGRALDLRPPERHLGRLKALFSAVKRVTEKNPGLIRGVGRYPGFIHIDTRPGDRLYTWVGGRLDADLDPWKP
jgi:uncharacterized protein YcbK (DUF882 family)